MIRSKKESVEDPFGHYVRGSEKQSEEFLQSFREAVDAIRAKKYVEQNRFGRSESREN